MAQRKVHNKDQKAVRKDAFIKLGLGLVALLLIVDTIQISRFGAIVERVDEYNKGVVDEMGGFRQDIALMGSDLNEMRKFLLMPTREYSFMETTQIEQNSQAQELSSTEKAAYNFLTGYISEQQTANNTQLAKTRIEELVKNTDLSAALSEQELTLDSTTTETDTAYTFKISSPEQGALAAIICEKTTNKLSAQSILGSQELNSDNDATAIQNYITTNKDKIIKIKKQTEERKQQLVTAMQTEEIKNALKEKDITFSDQPTDSADSLDFQILNKDGNSIFTIKVTKQDGSIIAESQQLDLNLNLAAQLLPIIQSINPATEAEKLIAERRSELEQVFTEEAFADLLKTSGLTVTSEPREDYNKLIYDVTDSEGKVQFSFVIELSSGLYKVLKDDQEIDFFSLLQDGSKKKL